MQEEDVKTAHSFLTWLKREEAAKPCNSIVVLKITKEGTQMRQNYSLAVGSLQSQKSQWKCVHYK